MTHISNLRRRLALLAMALATVTFGVRALDTSYYAANSVLSTGRWVKVSVTTEGIHEVTYSQLRAWGFSDPSKVTVWGYGGERLTDNAFTTSVPDDLSQQYCLNSDDYQKVAWYGVPDYRVTMLTNQSFSRRRNYYSQSGSYFLTDSRPALDEPEAYPVTTDPSRDVLGWHTCLEYQEQEAINPMAGGTFFFGPSFLANGGTKVSLPVADYCPGAYFGGCLIYRFGCDTTDGMVLKAETEGDSFTLPASGVWPSVAASSVDIPRVFLLSTSPAVTLTPGAGASTATSLDVKFSIPEASLGTMTFASLDYVSMAYPRYNTLAGGRPQLLMQFVAVNATNHNFRIDGTGGADTPLLVWNVNNPCHVVPYALRRYNDYAVASVEATYTTSTGAARVIAWQPQLTQLQPVYEGPVANQNLHGDASPEVVVLTTPGLRAQAERLAALHRSHQGLKVKVVEPGEIYNEFGSGTPAAHAIRRYLKMHLDREPGKLRYLVLFGNGSWDNRHIIMSDDNHLPTYQAEQWENASSTTKCYSADSYFAKLDDGAMTENIRTSTMSIAVGRLPVDNISDAAAMVDKVQNYLVNPPVKGSWNRALLFCDDGDGNDHLVQAENIASIINNLSPGTTVAKCYNALYPFSNGVQAVLLHDAMRYYLRLGQGYLGYSGHGRADRLGKDQPLWSLGDVNSTDYPVAPFTTLATCNTFAFDQTSTDIGKAMLLQKGGGAINLVATGREVYKQHNQTLHMAVARAYFAAGEGTRSGDVYRTAHNDVVSSAGSELATNTMCYNLGGDPALPLYVPTLGVATIAVGGKAWSQGDAAVAVYPTKPFTLAGAVTKPDGTTDTSFNGTIHIDIYDGPTTVRSSSKGETDASHVSDVNLDETLLASAVATVTNGLFKATVTTPAPVRPDGVNRVSYFAADDTNTRFASGSFNGINVGPYDPDRAGSDTTPPVISAFYLDSPSFTNGDETGPDVTAYISIQADPSGFCVSSGSVGAGAKLVLDNLVNYQYVASAIQLNADGSASVTMSLNDLTDGQHTLSFSIADNAGNRSERTLNFVVVNRSATAVLAASAPLARDEVTFSLDHNFRSAPTGRLVVEDSEGSMVYSVDNCTFPHTWDLHDASGARVPDGRYHAYAVLRSGMQFGNTERVTVILLGHGEAAGH